MEMPPESVALRGRTLGAFVIVTLIWGSTWLVIRDQIGAGGGASGAIPVPAEWSVTWRFALAAIGLFALALARREKLTLDRPGAGLAALVGLFQFFANFQFVYRAEAFLTSGIVAVIYALLMVPNALLGRLLLRTPVSGRFLAGSAVAGGGIALLLLHEYRLALLQPAANPQTTPHGHVALGVALTLGGLLSASVANILQATPTGRRQPLVPMIAWAMVAGVIADASFAYVTQGPPRFDLRGEYVSGVAYLAIAGSVITFPLYFALIRAMGAGRAAYSGVAVPVVAMALSTVFEHYRWSVLAASGAALVMVGLLIALSAPKIAASPSTKLA